MELAFIWVEKFNSLVDFSLNLSNKYKYNYNKELNSLERSEELSLPENFFGDGITSVTGIFGKNGSGKTNCLKLIGTVMSRARSRIKSKFIVVVEGNDGPLIYCRVTGKDRLGPTNNFYGRVVEYKDEITGINTVFLSNTFDSSDMGFDKKILNLSINNRTKSGNEFLEIFEFLSNKDVGEGFSIPTEIGVAIRPLKNRGQKFIANSFDEKFLNNNEDDIMELADRYDRLIKRVNNRIRKKILPTYIPFVIIFNELFDLLKDGNDGDIDNRGRFNILNDLLTSLEVESISLNAIRNAFMDMLNTSPLDSKNANIRKSNREFAYKLIDDIEYLDNYFKSNPHIIEEINYSGISGFRFTLEPDFNDSKMIRDISVISKYSKSVFLDMSSGQKAIIGILSSIYSQIKTRRNDTLIMLDEADLYLHPEWQLLFMKKMVEILSIINKSSIQLIVTSHSPLIMTDFPKRCLILLKCKNKLTRIDNNEFNPFGANLYDLYSQGFFLKESKVGALAYEKIISLLTEVKENPIGSPLSQSFYQTLELISDEVSKVQIKKLAKDYD
ncbi:AAA family ATPase [Vibrio parahaemolyticus]|nr:AAA family ATPase [Vibrio parahaemolyticus]MDF5618489.1 AAA family ATPase [Vibrio parahaemolyticus]